jgi:hypothetical protein
MYSSTHSLTSELDGGEWSASRTGRFTPRKRAPGTHWIGGWVGPRAVLDEERGNKINNNNNNNNNIHLYIPNLHSSIKNKYFIFITIVTLIY